MGYVAHLMRLAELLSKLSSGNEESEENNINFSEIMARRSKDQWM